MKIKKKPFYKNIITMTKIIVSLLIFSGLGYVVFINIIVGDNNQQAIGNNNQQIIGDNNIQAQGNVMVITTIQQPNASNYSQTCPETLLVEMKIINHFGYTFNISGSSMHISTNFYNIKFGLPTGQEIFFDKFLQNESIPFGLCTKDRSNCYIFPYFRYDKEKDSVCIDAILNWTTEKITVKNMVQSASCIQDTNTGKFLIDFYK